MYNHFQLGKKYLQYYFSASNGKGHGTHSPFVFDFIQNVLNDKRHFYVYDEIEALRKELKKNNHLIEIEDYGAGSTVSKKKQRTVKKIATSALKPVKFGQLMFRMVNYYHLKTIIELGTSLGITASYLASADSKTMVTTMEGSSAIAQIARANFERLSLTNIDLILGNFDETLRPALQKINSIDFAFIDGNHRKEPTLHYFEQLMEHSHEYTILIFDDVHWSKEMEEAWEIIKADERVKLSIDLFFIGLIFFRTDFKEKQHFTIRF